MMHARFYHYYFTCIVTMVTSSGTVAVNVWHTGYTPNNISTINKQTFIVPELGFFTTVAMGTTRHGKAHSLIKYRSVSGSIIT